jgi:hypothetical protein
LSTPQRFADATEKDPPVIEIWFDGYPLRNVPNGKELEYERFEKSITFEVEMQATCHAFSNFFVS